MEEKCRLEQITGIYAGNNEFCLDQTKALCQRLRLPFYASEEGWACARDKEKFKQYCKACGLAVPQQYLINRLEEIEMLPETIFPVIVKPTDSCAQQGLSLCRNRQELKSGYQKAYAASAKGKVIIEEYIEGEELAVHYFIVEGHPFLIGVEDILCQPISGQKKGIFGQTPSVYTQTYIKQTSKKVEKLLQNMNCRQGNVFLQMIQKNGIFYFLEMGYRLEEVGLWINWKKLYQFSTLELMVELALGRSLSAQAEKLKIISLQKSQKLGGIYMIWANPGIIARIEGRGELEQIIPETKIFSRR